MSCDDVLMLIRGLNMKKLSKSQILQFVLAGK